MSKGDKFIELSRYLSRINDSEVKLEFGKIENILGTKLCSSAYKYSAYWHPSETHTITYSWMNEGFELKEINISEQYIVLRKQEKNG